MVNPVLIEVMRGALVESRHAGAVAVTDATGTLILRVGDVDQPVYPRSAVKGLQAIPLVETGATDRLHLTDEELALACASHGGEPGHVATAIGILAKAGLDARALACGAHWPSHQPSAYALARVAAAPSPLHNNCSGKHAGFLCVAGALGAPHLGYTAPSHPVQREVKQVLESLAGVDLAEDRCAIDGCSVPTWAIPLSALARAFSRFGCGEGLSPARAQAAARLRAACAAKPWHVAGTDRFCTRVMETFGARVFVKGGAEGMFCAALPGQGYGVAIKCDDGAGRAAEAIMATLIARLLPLSSAEDALLGTYIRPTLRNSAGIAVGQLRPAEALLRA
jgi:L-asparaginase II